MAFWCHLLISGEGISDAPDSSSPLAPSRDVGMVEAFADALLRHLGAADYQQPDYTSLPARSLNLRVRGMGPETRYAALLQFAMIHADQLGCSGVVYIVDSREERRDNEVLKALRTVRDEVAVKWTGWHTEGIVTDGRPPPTALGTAIHEIEAWLLADGERAASVLDTLKPNEFPNKAAEAMGDPKEDAQCPDEASKRGWRPLFRRHCRRAGRRLSEATARLDVARAARPTVLRTRCPCGYAPFWDEVQENMLPLVCPGPRKRK